jgi:hypothetical protein
MPAQNKSRIASKIRLPSGYPRLKNAVTERHREVTVTRTSIRDYARTQRTRYQKAQRAEKARILDEVAAVTGYHRKSAIRLLNRQATSSRFRRRGPGRPRKYIPAVGEAAAVLWEAAGQIGAKRLQPFVPELLERLVRFGEITISPRIAKLLRQVSPATLDRLLARARALNPRRAQSTTRAGSWLKSQIPVRTFADWDDARPGFLEADLVAHCGESTAGFYLCTLSTVDIATAWVELQPVWGHGQERVRGAIHRLRQRLPVPLQGLDCDNGSEFINHALFKYCQRERITFTRSRAYKKNDNAHVEQKNGAIVRRLVGHDRYASKPALIQLEKLYELVRLHTNFFQPVQKLLSKSRNGAKVLRLYDKARTPYQRLLASDVLSSERRRQLQGLYNSLNPLQLKHQIDAQLEHLWTLVAPPDQNRKTPFSSVPPVTAYSEARARFGNR